MEKNAKPRHLDSNLKWLCKCCKKLLGMTDNSKKMLRLKYKDLYVYVEGDSFSVTVVCRNCGTINTVESV